MTNVAAFLQLVQVFCAARGIAEATLSTRLLSDGRRLQKIRQGADIGVRRMEAALGWLSAHWPEGVEWPSDIPRPAAIEHQEAAE